MPTPATLPMPADHRPLPRPTALMARTLLLVEDSHVTSGTVRLIFRHSAGRLRRAECLQAALGHLRVYAPDALLVDIGLPDGSGLDLIAMANGLRPRAGLIVAISGQPDQHSAARQAGADAFLAKPFASMTQFCAVLAPVFPDLAGMADGLHPAPDPVALRHDLQLACDMLLGDGGQANRAYALQFTAALARSLCDQPLICAVQQAEQSGAVTTLALMLRQRLRQTALI